MKRFIIGVMVIAVLIPVGVFAQDASSTEVIALNDVERVTITPSSPFFFLKTAFEQIGTLFTFGDNAKAERYTELAQRRLAEARQLAVEGDEAAEEAIALYQDRIQQAQELAEKVGETAVERVARITNNHIGVLEAVLERVPEEAQNSIERVLERAKERQQLLIERVESDNPTAAAELGIEALQERVRVIQENNNGDVEDVERWRAIIERMREQHPEVAEIISEQLGGVVEGLDEWEESDEISEQLRQRINTIKEDIEEGRERALEQLRINNPEAADRILQQSIQLRSRIENEDEDEMLRERFEQQIRSQMPDEGIMEQMQQQERNYDDDEDDDDDDGYGAKSPLQRFEQNLINNPTGNQNGGGQQ